MSAYPNINKMNPRPIRKPVKVQQKDTPGPPVFIRPVIETMIRLQGDRGRGVFAFTAPNAGAGTSYVVNLLARELTRELQCCVGVVPSSALDPKDVVRLPQGYVERAPNVWVALADQELERLPDTLLEEVWISVSLQSFDFLLVDCPALTTASHALRFGKTVDGVFLVVAAGTTKVSEIEQAQALLKSGSDRLQGIILNRRTYAIPKFIFKFL